MKKKKLNTLVLNKKSISKFTVVVGGIDIRRSIFDHDGCMSENGCTTGPDQTLTCWHYSCTCR